MWHNQAILTDAEFVLNGRLGELECLVAGIKRFSQEHSLGDEVEFDLNLVLEELFTNSVKYGGCAGMENAVEVRLEVRDDGVWVEYSDCGRAFDPLTVPPPNLEAKIEERCAGGLGIHLVRQVMQDLEYQRVDGRNRISMRRPTS